MSIRKPLIGFSIFAVIAFMLIWIVGTTLNRVVPGDTNTYSATFSDVLGLKPGSDVRMAGVRVGRVDKVEVDDDNNAKVTFIVQSDQPLYTNTKATIKYQNLIGQRFLGLFPGKGEAAPLEDGGTIPMYYAGTKDRQTVDSYDISALLGGFEPLLGALKPDQINSLTSTLVMALQGDQVSLAGFITQAGALAETFAARDQLIGDVLINMSGLLKGVAGKNAELENLIAQARALLGGLTDQGESLKTSTEQIAQASNSLVGIVNQLQPLIRKAQNSTTEAMAVLITAGPSLDQAAIDLPYVLRDLGSTVDSGNYLTAYICGLDISLWGVLLPRGIISQIGGNGHTEVCR